MLNTSINAHIGMPNTTIYAASKAALLSLAKTLSGELAGRGIRVNAVSPGPIKTPLLSKLGVSREELEGINESIRRQIPIGRFGDTRRSPRLSSSWGPTRRHSRWAVNW